MPRFDKFIRAITRADRLSLRAKLAGGFIAVVCLTLLVGTASLWSQKQVLMSFERFINVDDRIADHSMRSEVAMLRARKYEKDFFLKVREFGFLEARTRYAGLLRKEMADIRQNMESIRRLRADPEIGRQTREIEETAGRYEAGYLRVIELYGTLGVTDTGLEGRFRAKAHEIEGLLKRSPNDLLMSDLLFLRRREKDFLLRGLDRHWREFAEDVEKFKGDVAHADLPAAQMGKIVRLADDYHGLFVQYVWVRSEILQATATYVAAVQKIEPLLEELNAASAQAAAATRARMDRLTRAAGLTIMVVSSCAILAGGLVAVLISRKIMRSVSQTMAFADLIARGNLGTRMKPQGESEFDAIAASLNGMADALHGARETQKQYEEQLERKANYDDLTGIPNRNLLYDRFRHALAYAGRTRREVAVLFIDLDRFKFLNDSLGHDIGDQFLKLVSDRLVECIRASDTAARFAGDKFIILLPDLAQSEYADRAAQRIHKALSLPLKTGGHEYVLSCSIGISVYPRDGESERDLLRNADLAMYRAKEEGRNTTRFYRGELNERVVSRVQMETRLRIALDKNELFLHYQPQVDLRSGQVIGTEALLRWQNPDLGMVSPAKFIPLAEETGFIVSIGEWALARACAQSRAWRDAGFPPLTMAVNLSARQFWDSDLIKTIAGIMHASGMEPQRLELEITETMVMRDPEKATSMLRALKELGVLLSMDDFGTGYSSLTTLKRFPFDKLKIDISFIREITLDPASAAIVKTIIMMAHNLNLRVIAEGVETEGQLAYLRDQGCDDMQGYFFSKPLAADGVTVLLREGKQL